MNLIKFNVKKVYQINAQRVRILAESDGHPFPRIKPQRPGNAKQNERLVSAQKSGPADIAFTQFSLHKRQKVISHANEDSNTRSIHPVNLSMNTIQDAPKKLSAKKGLKGKKKDGDEKMDED